MKYLLLAIFLVGVILVSGCIQNNDTKDNKTQQTNSTINISNKTLQQHPKLNVSLGREFTLYDDQSARIENEDYEIKMEFSDGSCAGSCITTFFGIRFEHSHNGKVEKNKIDYEGISKIVEAFGYVTTVIDTDRKTYAKLKIEKIVNESELKPVSRPPDGPLDFSCAKTVVFYKSNTPIKDLIFNDTAVDVIKKAIIADYSSYNLTENRIKLNRGNILEIYPLYKENQIIGVVTTRIFEASVNRSWSGFSNGSWDAPSYRLLGEFPIDENGNVYRFVNPCGA